MADISLVHPIVANNPPDRRVAALTAAIGVLERHKDHAFTDAVELYRQLTAGGALDAKLIRSVAAALLVRSMSPKTRDERMEVVQRKTFFEAAIEVLGFSAPLPTRQHIARVHREFAAVFSRRPSKVEEKPPAVAKN